MFEFAAFCIAGPAEGPKFLGAIEMNCLFLFMFSFFKGVSKFRGGPAGTCLPSKIEKHCAGIGRNKSLVRYLLSSKLVQIGPDLSKVV